MINFIEITAQCTIAAARNIGHPYTDMKDVILQFTTKPKWPCYFDLHTLPPHGDIRPPLHMAKKLIGGSSTPTEGHRAVAGPGRSILPGSGLSTVVIPT
jgi:hypothetical protein